MRVTRRKFAQTMAAIVIAAAASPAKPAKPATSPTPEPVIRRPKPVAKKSTLLNGKPRG